MLLQYDVTVSTYNDKQLPDRLHLRMMRCGGGGSRCNNAAARAAGWKGTITQTVLSWHVIIGVVNEDERGATCNR